MRKNMKKILIFFSFIFLVPNIVFASSRCDYSTDFQSYHLPIKYWYDNFDSIQSEKNWKETRVWSWEYNETDSFGEKGYVWCERTDWNGISWWIINYTPNKFSGAYGKWVVGYQSDTGYCTCKYFQGWCFVNVHDIELRLFDGDIIADFRHGELTTPIDSCSGSGGGHDGVGVLVFNNSLHVVEMYRVKTDGTLDYICSASIPPDYNPSGYIQLAVKLEFDKSGGCEIISLCRPYAQFDYIEWGVGEPGATTTTILGNVTYPEAPTINIAWFSSLCCEKGCYFVPYVCYFIATILTLSISISIAYKLKNGIFGIITSLLLIIFFTGINFYPLWLGIVVSILLSFIILSALIKKGG